MLDIPRTSGRTFGGPSTEGFHKFIVDMWQVIEWRPHDMRGDLWLISGLRFGELRTGIKNIYDVLAMMKHAERE